MRYKTICATVMLTCVLVGSIRGEDKNDWPPPTIEPTSVQDKAVLVPPAELADSDFFTIASEPPRMTFSTMTSLPKLPKEGHGLWASWGEGIVASDGKYYVGIGDHRGIDANCYLYEYDPATHRHRQVVDMAKLIGQQPGDYGHGKLHGRLDEMSDGWIYFATYWGLHPDNMPEEQRKKIGGQLVRYSVRIGRVENLGMPLLGDSFPMHATDTKRGIFHGLGLLGGYVAYDIQQRRSIYNGQLPKDITWDLRSTLIDPKTGCCYGTAMDETRQIVGYDPKRNAFFRTTATVPEHPQPDKEKKPYIRSYTQNRLPDGSFICQTYDGLMFKFFPDEQRTERIGLNWVEGLYSTSMTVSPGGKYVYYTVGAHGNTWRYGSPIIQMDTTTYTKKVIAFLHPFYHNKCKYAFGGSYSVRLDKKGERLMMFWNGRFRETQDGESFGHPAFLCVEIPAAERVEP